MPLPAIYYTKWTGFLKMSNHKYNWEEAHEFFIRSGCSLLVVSEKMRIPYQTVRRYAGGHRWHSERYRADFKKEHGISFDEHLKVLERDFRDKWLSNK